MSSIALEKWLTSVGIDLGTSTTKWIVSKLKVVETSGGFSLPRYEITERRLAYISPVFSTPLLGESEIDLQALSGLLEREYQQAGIKPQDVQTGAVIITGETATKDNSEKIVHAMAGHAGQFVVATAGADLESLLAGRGSGAAARSARQPGVIVNVDVGGGTANAAYFRDGAMIGTVTLHIGGRLIRLTPEGKVVYVSAHWQLWAKQQGYESELPAIGSLLPLAALRLLCKRMADHLYSCIISGGHAVRCGWETDVLLVAPPAGELPMPGEIFISGGVGALMDMSDSLTMEEIAKYGDIGPELGAQLAQLASRHGVPVRQAEESARATVIGAGTHMTEVSGATLYYDLEALPLRNIPVGICRLPPADDELEQVVRASVQLAAGLYGSGMSDPPFALALQGGGVCSYIRLQKLAAALYAEYTATAPESSVLLVICQNDMAKALGHALAKRLRGKQRLVCVDQINAADGDYVDVGLPIKEDMVPVIMKTLVFHRRESGEEQA
ncbi:ethanolamine ammonia-lyase reactivating factor EutA [Paenibacillus algorifonticola]|uniref:ethanolamine ammonia-lyase reactivating factor EutA n=1 Tax=Paenibacillus algorifonticola TaxID=684063 RepID=UPI003D2ACB23